MWACRNCGRLRKYKIYFNFLLDVNCLIKALFCYFTFDVTLFIAYIYSAKLHQTAKQGPSLMYGPSVSIINIINDSHCFHRYNSRSEGFKQSCACFFFFYPSFFTAEFVQKVFERTAAPESKEDLVSLFVTVWTANHHCLASSVVTYLNGIETGDDVSCSIWSRVSLQCTHCTMCVYKQSRGEVEWRY